jgi:L-threonylcarbamoyladenylate synthase
MLRGKGDNENVKTLRLTLDPHPPETPEGQRALNETLDRAANILRAGGLVALPTETVYGLGANAFDKAAVERIFAAKQRPAWDPVIVHIASASMLKGLVAEVPPAARLLMDAFWPGPLTLLLPRSNAVPDAVTAGRPLVGVRMPAHPVALALIRRAGVPIAAPSANLFAHVSPTTAAHVLEDLDGRIDAVLDAGPTAHGVESTVLDPCATPLMIYRPGAVTAEQIREIAGPVEIYGGEKELPEAPAGGTGAHEANPGGTSFDALPAPGVGLRHYSPRARLVLVDGPLAELESKLAEAGRSLPPADGAGRLGVMLPAEVLLPQELASSRIYRWGRWAAPEEMARLLYAGLRELDAQDCGVILCPLPPGDGIGAAIRDRLRKAARSG